MKPLDTTDLSALRGALTDLDQDTKNVAKIMHEVIGQLAELVRYTTELETVDRSLELTDESMKADGVTALEKKELEESKKPLEARKTLAESVLTADHVQLVMDKCDDAKSFLDLIKRKLGAIK